MKKLNLILALTVLSVLTVGCSEDESNKDSYEVIGSSLTESGDIVELPDSMGDFHYHMIINNNGEEILEDNNGNIINKNEDGKFYDSEGNEIVNYDNSNSLTIETLAEEELQEVINDMELAEQIMHQDDKELYEDPRLKDIANDNKNEAIEFDPYHGSKVANPGTKIEQTIFTNNGIDVSTVITVNDEKIDSSGKVTADITIAYDYNTLFENNKQFYADDDTANSSLQTESISCVLAVYCTNGSVYYSDTVTDNINSSGNLTGNFTVSVKEDETIEYASIIISSSEIKLG